VTAEAAVSARRLARGWRLYRRDLIGAGLIVLGTVRRGIESWSTDEMNMAASGAPLMHARCSRAIQRPSAIDPIL